MPKAEIGLPKMKPDGQGGLVLAEPATCKHCRNPIERGPLMTWVHVGSLLRDCEQVS